MPRLTPWHWRDLERVFPALGFALERQTASHRIYSRQGVGRALVIPAYRQVPVHIILNLINTAGISREEFLNLLDR